MTGWLVYERNNVARNQRFIDFFMEAARAQGAELHLITTDEIIPLVTDGRAQLRPTPPDFAVMRCMQPFLSAHLERCGVRVFNSAAVSRVCNDKRQTHLFFAAHGLPAMPTAFVSPDAPRHGFCYPVVLKGARSCGGRKVFLCENEAAYLEKLALIAPDDGVVQPLCDTPGQDVRVYLLNGQPVQAMLRYTENDFRSNFGLHGQARPAAATEGMLRACRVIAQSLQPDLVGVDFIFHQGKPCLNEIEDAVGTRMLYQYTDINIVSLYMTHILRSLRSPSA